jgi:regulator of ribonuclease activity A
VLHGKEVQDRRTRLLPSCVVCFPSLPQIGDMPLGVKALGTNPIKSDKRDPGERDVAVTFAGTTFRPGQYVYADDDGIVLSERALH